MKLSNVIVFDMAFKKAFGKLLKKEHPSTVSLKLYKISKEIDTHTGDVYKIRDELLNRYCAKDENGNIKYDGTMPSFDTPENQTKFFEEMNALLQDEFEIKLTEKIKLPEDCVISPEDIAILEPFLDI